MDTKGLLVIGALAAAGVYAAKKLGGIAGNAYQGAVSGTADVLMRLIGPEDKSESLFYTVQFPNGATHAVGKNAISSDGTFTLTVPPLAATRWKLLVNPAITSGVNKFAQAY